jgi:hypothetical protein
MPALCPNEKREMYCWKMTLSYKVTIDDGVRGGKQHRMQELHKGVSA